MEVQYMSLKEDAEVLINEVSYAVKNISISSSLPSSDNCVFLNIETKENALFTVRLSPQGFQVVSHALDKDENGSTTYPRVYETVYSLLENISESYVTVFGNALSVKLNALKDLQEKNAE
ncbi:GSK3B-interacting protein-like [Hydra vulgaris]|uniref:GSK3-beta interaction protein n=1 Tax=Hydra vulgaris TaxID=6087 RepID=T2M3L3_HYDVU|nr:GSK3B-interacting protein-like [Hydra vulgaris]